MAFVGLLVVCDEEGEKFTSDGSVLHLQAGEKHLCSVVCPQELHPGFHNKALGSSVGSGCSHLLAPLSISGSSGAAAPRKAVNFGELERARDEAFRNLSCISLENTKPFTAFWFHEQ